jgi:hypothetical protein
MDRAAATLPADHRALPAVRTALGLSVAVGTAFVVFGYVTTQAKGIRAASPWQDDPYDGVVSFTVFLVPAIIVVMLVRMSLLRGRLPQPLFRIDQLLTASVVSTVLVAATMATDWLAVAARADHDLWDHNTPWLIASLVPLSLLVLANLALARRARRRLPARGGRRPDGDWLDDLRAVLDTVAPHLPMLLRRPVTLLRGSGAIESARRHIIAAAALLSLLACLPITTVEAVNERWTSPILIVTAASVGFAGFFAFCLIANGILHIAVPAAGSATRPVATGRTRRTRRTRRAAYWALIAALIAVPASAVTRDYIWSLYAGHRDQVGNAAQWAGVIAVSTLAVGLIAFCVALAAIKPESGARGRARIASARGDSSGRSRADH